MAVPTRAQVAALLKDDNRTAVGSLDPGFPENGYVASDVGPTGSDYGLAFNITDTAAAYEHVVNDTETLVVTIPHGNGGLTKDDLRTQYFHGNNTYDSTEVGFGAKRCFVNISGQPLDANGAPTTVALAIDAETTDLTALGEAVTNWAQCHKPDGERTPVPGTYQTSSRATSLYAPYVGWTVQNDI